MGTAKILAETKNLWMKLNLRGAILTSLSLQVFLVFFSLIRKRWSNWWIATLMWLAYLVADLVAIYAFGLISKAQINGDTLDSEVDAYGDLLAFWAPFLLLHLGGPDTITAFALDSLFPARRCTLCILSILPSNKLIVPTILMFVGGTTKYIERIRALHLASISKFRHSLLASLDAGQNYAKLMEVYYSKKEADIPASIEMMPVLHIASADSEVKDKLCDRKVIEEAFNYFTTFKGLLVDLIFSFRESRKSREFFRGITAKDAFRVIEAELNFFYDVLYTKAAVVHCSRGYLFRATSVGSIVTAFVRFYVLNKHGFHKNDIQITYSLLLGAVRLKFVALCRLICSDWTIAKMGTSILIKFLLILKSESSPFALHILHARWSKSISHYNLIDSRLKMLPKWIEKPLYLIALGDFLDDLMFYLINMSMMGCNENASFCLDMLRWKETF